MWTAAPARAGVRETLVSSRGRCLAVALELALTLVLDLALGAPWPVAAQEALVEVRATVVLIDGADIFVDVRAPVAERGLVLRLYRPIEVTHPVTHRTLRDRFLLGEIEITAPGSVLSAARAHGTLARPVAIGDAAETEIAPPAPPPPPLARTGPDTAPEVASGETDGAPSVGAASDAVASATAYTDGAAATTIDPETVALLDLLDQTLGRSPEHRVIVLRRYITEHPSSPYREELARDAAAMDRFATLTGGSDAEARARLMREAFLADPIEHAEAGVARDVAVGIRPGTPLRAVRLHVRTRGADAYETLSFFADGPAHARVTIPAELVVAPALEYFIEATDVEGLTVSVIADARHPRRIAVRGTAPGETIPRRSVRVTGEYVGFDSFAPSPGRDWYFLGELDVLYRVLADWLYGVRLGYGGLGGQSRSVADLRMPGVPLAPFPAGFTYGYLELEGHIVDLLGVAGRLELGVGVPGDPSVQAADVNFGGQLRIRIGEEYGTHLLLGGEFSTAVGQRAFVALAWAVAREWPSRVEVHVTDQPVSAGLGVRVVLEQGYRLGGSFAIAVRLSLQGRRLDHVGMGAGLALSFDW